MSALLTEELIKEMREMYILNDKYRWRKGWVEKPEGYTKIEVWIHSRINGMIFGERHICSKTVRDGLWYDGWRGENIFDWQIMLWRPHFNDEPSEELMEEVEKMKLIGVGSVKMK